MSVYTLDCSACKKVFKTLYSLNKHVRERHEIENELLSMFKDQEGKMVSVPKPRDQLPSQMLKDYKIWIGGLVERINSTFHPRLPGEYFVCAVFTLYMKTNANLMHGLLHCFDKKKNRSCF